MHFPGPRFEVRAARAVAEHREIVEPDPDIAAARVPGCRFSQSFISGKSGNRWKTGASSELKILIPSTSCSSPWLWRELEAAQAL
jgi:hypothetical protein